MADTNSQDAPRRPERRATLRFGQRELSRMTLFISIVIVGALGFAAYHVFLGFKAHRDIMIARDHMLALYKAMGGYAQDWDGRLPPADRWTEAVSGYLSAPPNTPGGPKSYLHGPGDGPTVGYVYNDLAAGYSLENGKNARNRPIDSSRLVLLIEQVGVGDNAHRPIPLQENTQAEEDLYKALAFPHYSDDPKSATTVILYANGSIVTMTRQDFKQ
jgi:hypothetical protein